MDSTSGEWPNFDLRDPFDADQDPVATSDRSHTEADHDPADAPELIDLVQFYALRMDPLTLNVESATHQKGWIAVADGDVVGAWTASGIKGVEAFVEIVSWDRTRVSGLNREAFDERNIDLPMSQLLMETYWAAQDHTPSEPPASDPFVAGDPFTVFDSEERGLDEDTVSKALDEVLSPPDGVTKEVLECAQKLSELDGFIAVAFFDERGEIIETLGKRSRLEVPDWLSLVVESRAADPRSLQCEFMSFDHLDVLLPPVGESSISFLLRLDRNRCNRGLVAVALREYRRPDPEDD